MPPDASSQNQLINGVPFQELMERLRNRDPVAAQQVFNHHFRRLVALARKRLEPQIRQKEDPEDVVQSVFRSFFNRYQTGSLDLRNWENVWAMLALITSRKCAGRADRYFAECRDVSREQGAAAASGDLEAEWELSGSEPSPEAEAILKELIVELLASFTDERHRQIIQMALEGMTAQKICQQLQCSERMVHRILDRVRNWLADHGQEAG